MAQISTKWQITAFTGMTGPSWAPVINPLAECRRITITNPDGAAAIEVTTDQAVAEAVRSIPAGQSLVVEISTHLLRGFVAGDTVCFVKGAGAQPKITFEG